ncbi:MAG: hypothetical protein M1813_000673 [Trichoglossum hirsutum]|nr:MAG: hypothetical protein M1813_000673 [Trichoglossum hirsutum]
MHLLGIPGMNRQLSSTRSEETFQFIQSCLDGCSDAHDCINLPVEPSQVYPTRLIQITALSANAPFIEDSISLQLVNSQDVRPKYITLSHCWGDLPQRSRTIQSNISRRMSSIGFEELTPTFRDALEITYRLGMRYLWVDAMCIIQNSQEDWVSESVRMGDIYQNSFLTIAASKGKDSLSGCFNQTSATIDRLIRPSSGHGRPKFENIYSDSDTKPRDRKFFNITTPTSSGKDSTIILWSDNARDEPLPLESSLLNRRGWIMQERILSPRTVHFTESQVIWECQKRYIAEDRSPVIMGIWQTKAGMLRMAESPEAVSRSKMLDHWYGKIVTPNYAGRIFTKSEDRLIALAGLARTYQNSLTSEYVAGIWKSSFAFGLAWEHERPGTADSDTAPCLSQRYPSWSWASHHGLFKWPGDDYNFRANRHFSLVNINLEFLGQTPTEFSPVTGGFITVTGKMFDIPICREPGSSEAESFITRYAVRLLFDHAAPKPSSSLRGALSSLVRKKAVKAIVLGGFPIYQRQRIYFLLVEPDTHRTSAYLRVGSSYVHYDIAEAQRVEALFDGSTFSTQTVRLY